MDKAMDKARMTKSSARGFELVVPRWSLEDQLSAEPLDLSEVGCLRRVDLEEAAPWSSSSSSSSERSPLVRIWGEKEAKAPPEVALVRVWSQLGGPKATSSSESSSHEDEFSPEGGVPLGTFGVRSEVSMPAAEAEALLARLDPSGGQSAGVIVVRAPAPIFVKAFVLALHDVAAAAAAQKGGQSERHAVAAGEVTSKNVFAVLAVGTALGLRSVQRVAVDVLCQAMSGRQSLRAAAFAAAVDDSRCLLAAYATVKAIGFKPPTGFAYRSGCLEFEDCAVPVTVFEDMTRRERDLKDPFFNNNQNGDDATATSKTLSGDQDDSKGPRTLNRTVLVDDDTSKVVDGIDDDGGKGVADDDDSGKVVTSSNTSSRRRRRERPQEDLSSSLGEEASKCADRRDDDDDDVDESSALAAAAEETATLAADLAGVDDDGMIERPLGSSSSPRAPAAGLFSTELRRCYLVRRRGVAPSATGFLSSSAAPTTGTLLDDEFALYDDRSLQLLLSARGRKGSSSFVFALARARDGEAFFPAHAPEFLGESTGSLGGSRFVLRDWGLEVLPQACLPTLRRRVRAAVTYKANVLGRVPNTMRVAVVDGDRVHRFATRKAKWNPKLNMWTLDFQSRVKRASKKNFQLLHVAAGDAPHRDAASSSSSSSNHHQVKLLFGKVSKNRFSLDFAPPFAPATALFVALTTFASKLVAA